MLLLALALAQAEDVLSLDFNDAEDPWRDQSASPHTLESFTFVEDGFTGAGVTLDGRYASPAGGTAARFDGGSALRFQPQDTMVFGANDPITVRMWFRSNGHQRSSSYGRYRDRMHLAGLYSVSGRNFDFNLDDEDSGGQGIWVYWNGGGTPHTWSGGGTLGKWTDDQWYELIWVRDAGQARAWVRKTDGTLTLLETTPDTSTFGTSANGVLSYIGAATSAGSGNRSLGYRGLIDGFVMAREAQVPLAGPLDLCPDLEGVQSADADGDFVGDECDVCPSAYDPLQADADADGVGDVCDACEGEDAAGDADADGVCDDLDTCPDVADGPDVLRRRIVVNHDEWTLSNQGYTDAPAVARFVENLTDWFADGEPGSFLAYSGNFGLTGSNLAATVRGAGHTWTVDTSSPLTLARMRQFDAVFLGGTYGVDSAALTQYVREGGGVYIMGGTGTGGSSGEAAAWNTFLGEFGLEMVGASYNGISGSFATPAHPLFDGVPNLYYANGNTVRQIGPPSPWKATYTPPGHWGIYDERERLPFLLADADGDGVGDACDLCAGDDGSGDSDGDGECDNIDLCFGDNSTGDSDADGVCDDEDACEGDDASPDTDGDGVCEDIDLCLGDDVTGDTDDDGVCNDLDDCRGDDAAGDDDDDGVCDDLDLCVGDDATGDVDGDGVCGDLDQCVGDDASPDTDGDGVCEDLDLCFGDDATGDDDGDKVCNDRDICPAGDDNVDSDGDGVPNACDSCVGSTTDTDGDGVPDACDVCAEGDDADDADNDTVPDACDACTGDDRTGDTDQDGVCNNLDVCVGDDSAGDTDADGVCDDVDLCQGDDAAGDTDADGVCDDVDLCVGEDTSGDTDADGVCDDDDVCVGDDASGDTDADGVCDDVDLCTGDDALGDADDDGICDAPDTGDTGDTDSGDTGDTDTGDTGDSDSGDSDSDIEDTDEPTETDEPIDTDDTGLTDDGSGTYRGGCACSQSGVPAPTWGLFGLVGLLGLARRRRV